MNLAKNYKNDTFLELVNEVFFPPFIQPREEPTKMNVLDGENSYEIYVQAPGQKKENFDINIDRGVLTISSNFEESKEEFMKNWSRKEFYRNQFTRSFRIPEDVNTDEISAKYEDGILEVVVPKLKKEPKKTKIKIN